MKLRAVLLVPALGALVGGVLVASPAQAVRAQQITGTVSGPGGAGTVGPVRVELLSVVRGGNTKVVRFANNVPDGGRYSFSVPLNGTKNKTSRPYRLRISAPATAGSARSWFWRGKNGKPTTGGRYLRDASVVKATKYGAFRADFRYTTLSGTAPAGSRITVAAAPPSYKGGKEARRELDIPGCANVYATTTASNGAYRVDFLPYGAGDKRYMVAARLGEDERWNNSFGSCFDVQNYKYSRSNMLALNPAGTNHPVQVGASGNHLTVNGAFRGFKPTAQGDRWVSIREAQPGVPVLASPVVAEKATTRAGSATFYNLAPGRYYVELGRRTGCADWYPSRFTNNNTYFKGLDRGPERWKSFPYLSKLSGGANSGLEGIARRANPNPATSAEQGKKPRGFKGWMYRTHCKALGAGGIKTIDISGTGNARSTRVISKKGAIVKGHVSRVKGKTGTEMMVTLTSQDGKRVLRTDLTDGRGNFYVAGLTPGRWKITLNADSWRGIGRTFTGKHYIKVKAGRTYNAGHLRFK
ncbi:selenium-binding family protein [Aeromicrobium wangtongii]|uniref:selenium-binding family protein n=1 Tax=Aeromicrobium wangtongii TaxID=2969247 RepID=UPI002016C541|nr:selenium-binding family protein [Aeromicrobium wangtongii]MCL3818945.1 selenium-binding family protein [Aeromicrobium wangtongii]